jgi:hypothetical protein
VLHLHHRLSPGPLDLVHRGACALGVTVEQFGCRGGLHHHRGQAM